LSTANDRYAMFIALGAAEALVDAAPDAAVDVAAGDVAAAEELLLLLPLLQAVSARAATATAATAALRPRDRVAGKEGTAKLLCARSLGGGLADRPVGRVPARLTGFLSDTGCNVTD
jgi:hypothetical protein